MGDFDLSGVRFLAGVPFFKHLSDEDRLVLARALQREHYSPGQTVFSAGDPGDCLYIVHSGEIEVSIKNTLGDKIVIARLAEGELFGELSILDNGPRSATATASLETDLLVLHRNDLISFATSRPEAIKGLLLVVGQRLRETDELLSGHIVRNLNEVVEHDFTHLQQAACRIAALSGSVKFLIFHLLVILAWTGWNSGVLPVTIFDPFPYSVLCMVVTLEALFLSIVVLITQSLEGAREKIRSNVEYEVNLRAELEITHLHSKVDVMRSEILSRLHRMEDKIR